MRDLCAIAVMAKAPRAGKVKTRLTPLLTPDEAMAMSGAFLQDITANLALAAQDAPIARFIAFAPAGTEALFDGLLAPGTGLVLADGSIPAPAGVAGFGCSLLHAAQALFDQGHGAVCLLNSDSPTLPTAVLCQAATALMAPGERVVLGPAEDGGYYLIGMKQPHARLFADVTWSTDAVCAQTEDRIRDLGLDVVKLPTWYDVDDRMALARLMEDKATNPQPFPAPATRRLVAALGLAARLR